MEFIEEDENKCNMKEPENKNLQLYYLWKPNYKSKAKSSINLDISIEKIGLSSQVLQFNKENLLLNHPFNEKIYKLKINLPQFYSQHSFYYSQIEWLSKKMNGDIKKYCFNFTSEKYNEDSLTKTFNILLQNDFEKLQNI